MTNHPSDKRIEKGEQTREKILNAAISIIAESGIQGLTGGKLALETGISKSNIFHHFKSINDIPLAVMEMIFEEILRPVDLSGFENLRDYLTALGVSIFDIPIEHRKVYKAFFSFYYEGMFKEEYKNFLSAYAKKYMELISGQIKVLSAKSHPQDINDSIAALLLSSLDGLGLHNLIHDDPAPYVKAWKLQVQFICDFLNQ